MFQPAELQEDASYEKDLEADVKTECGKVGPVDKVLPFALVPLSSKAQYGLGLLSVR